MSAWIVSKGHIDALVQSMVVEGLIEMADAQQIGQMLWAENHLSVNARYREATDTPDYEPEMIEAPLSDHHVIAALHCYDYQTCEHDGYDTSEAFRLVDSLLNTLTTRSGGESPHATKWGYDNVAECVA